MAGDINRVIIVGRLTRDSELVYTASGFPILKMGVAVNRRKKTGDSWDEEAHFFDIEVFGKSGEALRPYLLRGKQIAVEGSLRQDRWEQNGSKRSRVTIAASEIQLLGGRRDGENTSPSPPPPRQETTTSTDASPSDEAFEDDIPF